MGIVNTASLFLNEVTCVSAQILISLKTVPFLNDLIIQPIIFPLIYMKECRLAQNDIVTFLSDIYYSNLK